MASFQFNRQQLVKQWRTLSCVVVALVLVFIIAASLMGEGNRHSAKLDKNPVDLTGIVDESFSEANSDSAMTAQQAELEHLKTQIKELKETVFTMASQQKNVATPVDVSSLVSQKINEAIAARNEIPAHLKTMLADNTTSMRTSNDANGIWHDETLSANPFGSKSTASPQPIKIHSVKFHYASKRVRHASRLSPERYVPSGTFVRAVVLGGADADASVNGQSKNNGVMLFKLLQPGTLPNGARSHLQGCFVTASAYGDISSERAYIALDKLSCAQPGRPIIDKAVQGWAFFNGKVGIKGMPLMRDNKVMQWAGISGMMSGIAGAAQYAQSVQSIGQLGATSLVPSSNIAPYAAYGGASKAADVLSNYYVKRAEQYHPVIQVGSGNVVTIVFKDGFYLEPEHDQDASRHVHNEHHQQQVTDAALSDEEPADFTVPDEVMAKIDRARPIGRSE